jgi:GT2 family glycosyltransferase
MTGERVALIIATYNRAVLLDECLTHACRQRFSPGDEIIVIDNGSTDDTCDVVGRHQRDCPVPVRFLHEPTPGKSHAIARGVAAATAEILAFTDDDVNLDEGWLDAVRIAMAAPNVALVGGPVEPRWQSTVPGWIRVAREQHPRLGAPVALLDYGPQPDDLGERTCLGANLAVRREVFNRVGGYPTTLGKLRGTLLSGEDDELCRRVQEAGFRARYAPHARVYHWVPADRARLGYFLRWFYWSGITHAIMDRDAPSASGRSLAGLPCYLVSRAALGSAAVVMSLLTGRWTRALDRALDVAFSAGYAAQRWGFTATEEV